MPGLRFLASVLFLELVFPAALRAELPLPDFTIYGRITTPAGVPVGSGELEARVRRGAMVVLEAPGFFKDAGGVLWYVVNVPLETAIGAPGPSGVGAHEGDRLESLLLDGKPLQLQAVPPPFTAGGVSQVDARTAGGELRIFRGDCSPNVRLDVTDAVSILYFLFIGPPPPTCLKACDSDGSGRLDISDGVYLLSFLFLGGSAPPDPGPACGPEQTPTPLSCIESSCAP